MADYKSVLEKFPPRGSKAHLDMMEKQQALETDTTLEGLLAAPVRGAMAAKGAVKSIIAPGTVGKNVARDEKQRDLIAEYVKNTGRHPFEAPADVVAKQRDVRRLTNAGKNVLENTAGNLAGNISFDAVAPEYKRGGKVTASSRADGIAQRGKTRGKMR
jgi:hypothetical protein